ncbi:hypothetical protein SBOR_10105 [Sclerotinia borealis F-4128]|uniref:Uncharacterized protein n=1 Tax=Sclerotinia borealis (strain F-4128) TaxID=1432307 RepID=W9C0S0_SCLBF|nr:hypothetical protein SBOR_10105 [Sclerotinia borealis F-4128]
MRRSKSKHELSDIKLSVGHIKLPLKSIPDESKALCKDSSSSQPESGEPTVPMKDNKSFDQMKPQADCENKILTKAHENLKTRYIAHACGSIASESNTSDTDSLCTESMSKTLRIEKKPPFPPIDLQTNTQVSPEQCLEVFKHVSATLNELEPIAREATVSQSRNHHEHCQDLIELHCRLLDDYVELLGIFQHGGLIY